MTDAPRVSVLLACYEPKWLREAIDSVREQTFQGLELLVLDDSNLGNVERTVIGLGDPRVRYVGNPVPLGPAANHSLGISLANGEYIGIINHDDVWKPNLLQDLVTALDQTPEATVAFGRHECIDAQGVVDVELGQEMDEAYGRSKLAPGLHQPFTHLAITRQALPVAQCALWRRSACPEIPAEAFGAYDWWLGYWLSRHGGGAVYVHKPLSQWRIHSNNLTSKPSLRRQRGSLYVARQILKDRTVRAEHAELRIKYLRMKYALWKGYAHLWRQGQRRTTLST